MSLRKRILSIILLGAIAVSLIACGNGSGSQSSGNLPAEITFGILRVPNEETIAIAAGLFDKYFTEKGIECNFVVFDSGSEANKALASGSIDFATMGNINSITALSRELNVEMVWIHEVLGEIEALAVKEGSGINKIEDLAGKRIAVPFASTCHFILLNVLKDAGIEGEVQLLDMQTTEIVAAWERGDIQAAYTWQPSLGKLLESGRVLISSQDMIEKGYITANVEVVKKDFARKYPELVTAVIACLTEAADIYRQNPEKAATIVAEELGITAEEALLQMQGSSWYTPEELLGEGFLGSTEEPGAFAVVMKNTADFLKKQKFIDYSPTQEEFNEYVNPLYIEKYLELE
ncbi:aliphatic sulfonate ABC transporter substrate-binding protein [Iocasia frigidifontis]|uniref:Aliphatic sulfonate ABC transporter substrate-binding protein n=1 Tax=Iocasia fonsfrigidae TaxID=2682810 RepID=A0A8A7KJC8_9FIRM|nr:aliphatic sulfonate ABC transporter substrate-binding protein [Iocasia fonsfrigidae]QTL98937.1 aliphatic sulfonate ABC transporter substrate-binding protein [Iocasia fonsfrigidae]